MNLKYLCVPLTMDYKNLYKLKGPDCQENRRELFLEDQARKRQDLLDEHRHILSNLNTLTDKKKTKERRTDISCLLMFSEWFSQPPLDLDTKWMFKICPEGRRCVVLSQNGKTMAISKDGKVFSEWKSLLPGNSHESLNKKNVTILDCIFSFDTNSCYVLDVLHWAELPLVGTEMSFRQFWIKSKLDETPELGERSESNKIAIIEAEGIPYSRESLEVTLSSFPFFQDDHPKVDGILFYHQDAYYTSGETPLVGWLKPFMVTEVLGVPVSNNYVCPENYVNYLDFIAVFNENYRKKKRGKVKSNLSSDVEMSQDDIEDITTE